MKTKLVGGWATPLKKINQLGWLFPIYGKIKNVPNHQPEPKFMWVCKQKFLKPSNHHRDFTNHGILQRNQDCIFWPDPGLSTRWWSPFLPHSPKISYGWRGCHPWRSKARTADFGLETTPSLRYRWATSNIKMFWNRPCASSVDFHFAHRNPRNIGLVDHQPGKKTGTWVRLNILCV